MKLRRIWGIFIVVALLRCSCYASKVNINNITDSNVSFTNVSSADVSSSDVSLSNISRVDVNSLNKNGDTPLLLAVKTSINFHLGIVETLIKNGADVNVKDSRGFTPLECVLLDSHVFAGYSNNVVKLHVAKVLLNNGAIVDINTVNGMKVANKIINSKNIDAVKIMFKNNKDVRDKISSDDCNWLAMAINNHDHELVKLLLDYGASVTTKDAHGNTPLHLAIATGNWSIVRLFFPEQTKLVNNT